MRPRPLGCMVVFFLILLSAMLYVMHIDMKAMRGHNDSQAPSVECE